MSISVVVPVFNGEAELEQCLAALRNSVVAPVEIIVVDDGSTDGSLEAAARHRARVLSTGGRNGPARARNLGAREARGEVLFFLDADVVAQADAVERVQAAFAEDVTLDALIGSDDDDPAERDFLSQYKNLMHCFVHQTGSPGGVPIGNGAAADDAA